ncbi:MAG TPA: 5'-3' exonuclease H3TH domain-containing protein, partial [Chloroflexia bacterium]|nr:5'-3' exonuclease H3TH domain-containing protein [Chloroflexia bacterium]
MPTSQGDTPVADNSSAPSTPVEGGRPKLVLVDGHALVYRAYHALPPDLRTSAGEPTNAVLGFTGMLFDTLRNHFPQHVVVTFDKGKTFRHEASAAYKAQRGPMPDDLREQLGRVRQLIEAMDIPIVELAGYEADDVIGTLSRQAEDQGLETYILTADTDQHQLVSEHVRMIAPGGYAQRFSEARVYDMDAVRERYGFGPELVPDYKALVGDKTDNIPNVPGIGEKTASQLLQQYGSLEGILEHIDELKPKQQESLRAHAEQAQHSKTLTTIVRDAPVDLDLARTEITGFHTEDVLQLLRELEFRSLVEKFNQVEAAYSGKATGASAQADETTAEAAPSTDGKRTGPQQLSMFGDETTATTAASEPTVDTTRRTAASELGSDEARARAGIPANVHVVRTEHDLSALAALLRRTGRFTIDVESTSSDEMEADLVGIAIALPSEDDVVDDGYYIPVGHRTGDDAATAKPDKNQLTVEAVKKHLGPVLADPAIKKDAHNAKYDLKVLNRSGLPVEGLGYDTMLAAYLAGETSTGLKDLAFTKLGVQMVPITELIGKGRNQTTMDLVSVDLAAPYAT